ncbi:ABC transporter ATP-binding protein/permease [Cardinium endosymbiont of Culicoides punctatus]|uniref:ABC transporter ATP-binding protein/permease n=1 Tax=Cardinium endosymbiont of Culicoides punctatus TaxID=2304601 RepID=UPI00105846EC|nr:ABC transporter ATP-binding protein/permease [Cardinium endosymbiont of Culicoides punctatus]TDG95386.1 ATM1-type heavy metal exporter [Cardinium endosymbiont of Culicoides punctatus]
MVASRIIKVYKLLLPYLWCSKSIRIATLTTALLMGIEVACTTLFPFIWEKIVASKPDTFTTSILLFIGLGLFGVSFIKKTLPPLSEVIFLKVINHTIKDLRFRTVKQAHSIPLKQFEEYNIAGILSGFNRFAQTCRIFMHAALLHVLPAFAKVITLSIALIRAHHYCYVIVVMLAVTFFVLFKKLFPNYLRAKEDGWHCTDCAVISADESLRSSAFIRFKCKEHLKFLESIFHQEADAWGRFNWAYYLLRISKDGIFYVFATSIFLSLLCEYSHYRLPLSKVVLIYTLLFSLYNQIGTFLADIRKLQGGIVDVVDTIDFLCLPIQKKEGVLPETTQPSIQLSNVGFNYNPNQKLLENINLTIKHGDKIGISGQSGSGKSTLCQMLIGLLTPHDGTVLLGDQPINNIDSDIIGKLLCYLPQHFLGTQVKVVGNTCIKHFYSGGESQLKLLEEVLKDQPKIIVLDETFNQMDDANALVMLDRIVIDVPTVVLVTHNRKLLDKMHVVVTLKNGKVE